MANRPNKAGARIVRDDWVERSHRAKHIRAAVGRALGADALDDIGEWRIDVVGPFALDIVKLPDYRARARIDRGHDVGRIDRDVGALDHFCHHPRASPRLADDAFDGIVGILNLKTGGMRFLRDVSPAVAGRDIGPRLAFLYPSEPVDQVRHHEVVVDPAVVLDIAGENLAGGRANLLRPYRPNAHVRG